MIAACTNTTETEISSQPARMSVDLIGVRYPPNLVPLHSCRVSAHNQGRSDKEVSQRLWYAYSCEVNQTSDFQSMNE